MVRILNGKSTTFWGGFRDLGNMCSRCHATASERRACSTTQCVEEAVEECRRCTIAAKIHASNLLLQGQKKLIIRKWVLKVMENLKLHAVARIFTVFYFFLNTDGHLFWLTCLLNGLVGSISASIAQ